METSFNRKGIEYSIIEMNMNIRYLSMQNSYGRKDNGQPRAIDSKLIAEWTSL